jgi:hypothetical protein
MVLFRSRLLRYNVQGQELSHNSREYGYLVLTLEYLDSSPMPAPTNTLVPDQAPNTERWVENDEEDEPKAPRQSSTSTTMHHRSTTRIGVLKLVVPPIKVRFVPDGKLSVNQIMEFKKLHNEMHLTLSRNQLDGCLKLCYIPASDAQSSEKMILKICHYTSEVSFAVLPEHFGSIIDMLDQLCVVVASNTFYQLDLQDVKQTGARQWDEWKNYLVNYLK